MSLPFLVSPFGCLSWAQVRALARALACSGLAADVAGQPLFQLANNELEGLEPCEATRKRAGQLEA